ncbi:MULTISPECIES: phosphoenolpyruvate--protein phosphotransferase [Acidiphilium]|jgi:phosphotransferase system enzyme I (PtsP)|uniref:phosphoenolpyruvate--protein phosphotransferase n=1 Tax=Acidiphilium rubrum TaxID=526 RepID=A0A8G2CIR7_ACIRU|nr:MULTISPECIES: phosphoenolpyruvate--protein phosphotransferase [Acidiphilium]OYW03088.1 MAG: phosphoenolpyruvate--protein phosphotransferase [Acidiphilium sp. 37-64-53]OZB30815.1 MAG: phosphoenolpyruvate--protein phosphotransferase [Acidiphilium sp. 34-64-41]SIQ32993.1 phosphotransferase system, enzyme I, PtsP [Acidiphilium rubrum]HQT85172.1 phosphoenolpyruvate--protein phosphotransferase [Acidiphilium rubrum]
MLEATPPDPALPESGAEPFAAARRLFAKLRERLSGGNSSLAELAELIASELEVEVCSIYVARPGEMLELAATYGLRIGAVGRTRLRVGEGIIGLAAAKGELMNLPDAQNHPEFAYRPETGEDRYASMLAVPIRRAGRTLGVIAVQNIEPRQYDTFEAETISTIAMLLGEILSAQGAGNIAPTGLGDSLSRRYAGHPLAPGIVRGSALPFGRSTGPRHVLADDPAAEIARLEQAMTEAEQSLDTLMADHLPQGHATREVLDAYRLISQGTGWLERVRSAINDGLTAEAAVDQVGSELRRRMRKIADPYLRERLADVEDMIERMLTALGAGTAKPDDASGMILIVRRLGPAELLDWHRRGIAGVAIEEASSGGHAAILARALDIPALAVEAGATEAAQQGDAVLLDAESGALILRPDPEVTALYERALAARSSRAAELSVYRDRPAATLDGTRLTLMLNVGLAFELDQLARTGAQGIGLYRTEIAALAAARVPGVAAQAADYRRVIERAAGQRVVFRTLDLGADKMLPGEADDAVENPAMGWRSLRVGLDRPAILRKQLRALLMGAAGHRLSIMFPMVATVAEFRAARDLLEAEAAKLADKPTEIEVGTMLEVPALLFQLPGLLAEADFISLGTNDLMQFLFAADRGTPKLAGRYDVLSAPVLELIEGLAAACAEEEVGFSICGEAAGRPLDALVFAAIGVNTLSMSGTAILPVKALLAAADLGAMRPVLRELRRAGAAGGSLRDPLTAWAREHGLPI